uniref:Uncharacterized protein n=1 Tax=Oryza brachyantha TaxID=4533 RepID=J3M1C3_ORYBR
MLPFFFSPSPFLLWKGREYQNISKRCCTNRVVLNYISHQVTTHTEQVSINKKKLIILEHLLQGCKNRGREKIRRRAPRERKGRKVTKSSMHECKKRAGMSRGED